MKEQDYQRIRNEALRSPRMTVLFDAFEEIAGGVAQVPEVAVRMAPEFVARCDWNRCYESTFMRRIGTFYRHALASIPYAFEEFARVDEALINFVAESGASASRPAAYWETSSADGTRGRVLAELAEGRIVTLSDSPNYANLVEFQRQICHSNSYFHLGSWVDVTPYYLANEGHHPAFIGKFDIIWENTTFQMYGRNRAEQMSYIKRVLKPDGVVIFLEKFVSPDRHRYARAEKLKDASFKSQYFSSAAIASKNKSILSVMEGAQVTIDEFVEAGQASPWTTTSFRSRC